MKNLLLLALALLTIYACKKDGNKEPTSEQPLPAPYQSPYPKPWKTEFVSFKNTNGETLNIGSTFTCGPHAYGYRLFYKDTLIRLECGNSNYGACRLENPLIINDSTMCLFKSSLSSIGWLGSSVLHTQNGGGYGGKPL
jgi:hypothetical protein